MYYGKVATAVSRGWQSKMNWVKLLSAWTRAYIIIIILIVVMVGPLVQLSLACEANDFMWLELFGPCVPLVAGTI